MKSTLTRNEAWELLQKYNQDRFHLQHALTLEAVMGWFARELGYADEAEDWGIIGLLHDLDFEQFPELHCRKAPELLSQAGASQEMIHAICSHGYGLVEGAPQPEHQMEKVLFAVDELTGLIGAAAIVRPSGSVQDMELKSVKKKYKSPAFAAGCSREAIARGAEDLGWELDDLITRTLNAMKDCEVEINNKINAL